MRKPLIFIRWLFARSYFWTIVCQCLCAYNYFLLIASACFYVAYTFGQFVVRVRFVWYVHCRFCGPHSLPTPAAQTCAAGNAGSPSPPHICRHCGPALAPTSPLITASPPVPCRARMNRVYPRCPAHSRTPHVVYMLIVMRAQPPMSITFLFSHFRQSGHSSPALFVPSCLSNLRCGFGGGGGAC